MGKGMTVLRSPQRKHMQIRQADQHMQTSLRGIAKRAEKELGCFCTKRAISKSLVRENRTQGSVRGLPGNR